MIFSPFAGLFADPLDLYEIEMQGLAFQNQVFVACVNRVGQEDVSHFAGGSFVAAPDGLVQIRALRNCDQLLIAELDLQQIEQYRIKRPFLRDRRPHLYQKFLKD